MNLLARLRDWLLERQIRAIRHAMSSALDRKEYKLAYTLLDELREACGRRSPKQVRRMEQAAGLSR
jgi:hypothetical protein